MSSFLIGLTPSMQATQLDNCAQRFVLLIEYRDSSSGISQFQWCYFFALGKKEVRSEERLFIDNLSRIIDNFPHKAENPRVEQ